MSVRKGESIFPVVTDFELFLEMTSTRTVRSPTVAKKDHDSGEGLAVAGCG
jgi:hypothetical protein